MKFQIKSHRLWISAKTHRRIRNASRSMSNAEHREVCGIFYQRGTQIVLERTQNKTVKSHKFKINWADQKKAKRKTDGVWGAFHSHPISEAKPSAGDIEGGPLKGFALIYDVIGDEFRLWRIERRAYTLMKTFDFNRDWLLEPYID
jgi:proteasome lid subunit RPN8/RPN11